MSGNRKIPGLSEWEGFECDLDVKYFFDLVYGKSNTEIQDIFGEGRSVERMDELLHSPRPIFQYYVFAFSEFVISSRAECDCDAASSFLTLLHEREKKDPGSVSNILDELSGAIEYVGNNQQYFNADIEIYGDFNNRVRLIRMQCDA